MSLRKIAIGTLLLASVGCNGTSTSPSPSPSPTDGTTVSIVAGASVLTTTAFSPSPVNVPVGTTITWKNNDSTTHTSTSNSGVWSSSIPPGGQFSVKLDTAGTYAYHCTIHPGMVGTVNVQ